jgi:hypothetical protein
MGELFRITFRKKCCEQNVLIFLCCFNIAIRVRIFQHQRQKEKKLFTTFFSKLNSEQLSHTNLVAKVSMESVLVQTILAPGISAAAHPNRVIECPHGFLASSCRLYFITHGLQLFYTPQPSPKPLTHTYIVYILVFLYPLPT